MNQTSKIVITGAAGFIASCMASHLNRLGYHQLYLVDDFSREDKRANHEHLHCIARIDRAMIDDFFMTQHDIELVIHLGARTDTTEMDYQIHETLNVVFSQKVWTYCAEHQIPMIYASSAATYGDGSLGYQDTHKIIEQLQPLNPYGVSKNEFDKWVLQQVASGAACPPHWYGLKFFNVYGPNEYHKGRMASVIFHAFHQIQSSGNMKLFRSHRDDYSDGGQMRDFIYVHDVIDIIEWLFTHLPESGLYNVGTGKATSFLALAQAVFSSMKVTEHIEFIDTPEDIRDKYQYFTEADMHKLRTAGYTKKFRSLEEGVSDYVGNYLIPHTIF